MDDTCDFVGIDMQMYITENITASVLSDWNLSSHC